MGFSLIRSDFRCVISDKIDFLQRSPPCLLFIYQLPPILQSEEKGGVQRRLVSSNCELSNALATKDIKVGHGAQSRLNHDNNIARAPGRSITGVYNPKRHHSILFISTLANRSVLQGAVPYFTVLLKANGDCPFGLPRERVSSK